MQSSEHDALTVDGVTLETRWVGPAPDVAPTIVMLHEGLGSVSQWRDIPEQLADSTGCGVFLYSRRGYGRSDPVPLPRPMTYMHDEALHTLPAALDAVGFTHGVLLGHSDGASIAAIYAGSRPDGRVRGLVLIAPHFFVEPVALAGIAVARAAYEAGPLRDRLARYHGDNVDGAFWGWSRAWLDPTFAKWDIQDCLRRIRVPMLVVQGSDDQYATLAQVETAKSGSAAKVDVAVIPDARHAPHFEQPDATLSRITTFISSVVNQ